MNEDKDILINIAQDYVSDHVREAQLMNINWSEMIDAMLYQIPDRWRPIETAPTDGTQVWVYVAAYEGLPAFACKCAYHPDAGWCADELRPVTHWKPLETLPK